MVNFGRFPIRSSPKGASYVPSLQISYRLGWLFPALTINFTASLTLRGAVSLCCCPFAYSSRALFSYSHLVGSLQYVPYFWHLSSWSSSDENHCFVEFDLRDSSGLVVKSEMSAKRWERGVRCGNTGRHQVTTGGTSPMQAIHLPK